MTVDELPYFTTQVHADTPGSDIAALFEKDKTLPGIIVNRGESQPGLVTRHRFYQRLGRLYGVEIYTPRPIAFYLETESEQPLILAGSLPVQKAVVSCLERGNSVYDPFIALIPGKGPRLITFQSLILKQTELLSVAQVEAQAQRAMAITASQAKSDFLAVMSHELRTPLTAIIGYAEIVLEDAAADCLDDVPLRVGNIHRAGLHLLEMINGILDLAKVEAGKAELSLEQFAISGLVEELAGTLIPLVEKNENEFRLISEKGLGTMICDKTKLKQCLLNLLGNASKFTQKGRVTLHVSREEYGRLPWAIFEVTDTGIGMTEAQLQKLFQPFFQADSSISRRFGGTGLGLSLTKRYCEMMGGTLSVRSVPEQGSTFTMRLPVGAQALPEPAAITPRPPARKQRSGRKRRQISLS